MTIFNNKKVLGAVISILLISFLFVIASILSSIFENNIKQFVEAGSFISKVLYVLITSVAIVIAPVSTFPLMPIASHVWGWFVAGILSIAGWVIGSQIAFLLARRFGKSFVEKFFSLKKLHSFENYFTSKNLFWTVVLLRMMLPVDLLSYALGLFSKISTKSFFFSTLIGVTPFAFIFSYTGGLSTGLQIIALIEIAAFLGVIYIIKKVIIDKNKNV